MLPLGTDSPKGQTAEEFKCAGAINNLFPPFYIWKPIPPMNKRAILISFLVSLVHVSLAQFTKVTSQPPVSDGLNSSGAAWVDYDNDGDDDLFVTTHASPESAVSKDVLYRNNGDGTFTTVTGSALVSEDGTGRNATWADYDNDGSIDVFISNQIETFLYKNEGGEKFTKVTALPTMPLSFDSDHQGGAWGDYNADGFLDLFVGSYQLSDNARNFLFKNNGDGTFTMEPATNIVCAKGYSTDPSWIDYDQNGTLDLFVPNYGGTPNFLYTNLGDGSFAKVADNHLVAVSIASVGSSWADYDSDGDFDVLVATNVNASNFFFENTGDGTFSIKSGMFGSTLSSAAAWADFDNDGHIDVMLAGGDGDKTYLFRNNGDKTFSDVSAAEGITNLSYSNAVASADYDRDGSVDFFIATSHGNSRPADDILYHNTPNGNHWISVKAVGTITNRDAIGASVRVNTGDRWQARAIQSKTGPNAQNSLLAHFGLGQSTTVDRIVVEWPGKGFTEIVNTNADQFITITETTSFPAPPEQVVASADIPGQIEVSWTDNASDETGFRIERSKGDASFIVIGEAESNVTSFTDKTIARGNTYTYRVAAKTNGGFSTYSPEVAVELVTSVEEEVEQNLFVYPNPAGDYLYIKKAGSDSLPLRILNTAGVVVKTFSSTADDDRFYIQDLAAGFYIVSIGNRKIRMIKK